MTDIFFINFVNVAGYDEELWAKIFSEICADLFHSDRHQIYCLFAKHRL